MMNVLKQWSTVRGFLLVIAAAFGVPAVEATAVVGLMDYLPDVATAAVGVWEVFRDEKTKIVVEGKKSTEDFQKMSDKQLADHKRKQFVSGR